MIIPGVQKPHWRPCWSQNACWSGVEGRAVGHALDRLDLGAVGLDGEHRAGLGALAVDVDRARAAVARVAADVRAGQPEDVAQQMDEQEPRLDVGLAGLAVDGERDVVGASSSSSSPQRESAVDGGPKRADGHLGDHRPLVVGRSVAVGRRAALGRGRVAGLAEERPRSGAGP